MGIIGIQSEHAFYLVMRILINNRTVLACLTKGIIAPQQYQSYGVYFNFCEDTSCSKLMRLLCVEQPRSATSTPGNCASSRHRREAWESRQSPVVLNTVAIRQYYIYRQNSPNAFSIIACNTRIIDDCGAIIQSPLLYATS